MPSWLEADAPWLVSTFAAGCCTCEWTHLGGVPCKGNGVSIPGSRCSSQSNYLVIQSPNTYFFSQLYQNNTSPNIMSLHGQLKRSPSPSQREIIQILISICLWLQVTAFWGKVIPCLSLPWSWLDILKPMEQVVKLATANAFCVQLWGRGMKQKGKLRYIKAHMHNKKRICG